MCHTQPKSIAIGILHDILIIYLTCSTIVIFLDNQNCGDIILIGYELIRFKFYRKSENERLSKSEIIIVILLLFFTKVSHSTQKTNLSKYCQALFAEISLSYPSFDQ